MADDPDDHVILPKGWPEQARGAFLNAVAMGRMVLLQGLSGFEHGRCPDAQHFAEFEALRARCALLEEVARIKDGRYSRVPPQKRPQYTPQERLAILAARATAGWSAAQTAECFQVNPKTIASWTQRIDDPGEPELVATPTPVNKYPDFVRSLIQQFLCPPCARYACLFPALSGRGRKRPRANGGNRVVPETAKRAAPKHIVSDQGCQFQDVYRAWCKKNNVLPRFGAIGQHGSIAILERYWRSLKTELFRRLIIVPNISRIETELALYVTWYNEHRPHRGLGGLTPNERLSGGVPAREQTSLEVRPDMPLARGDPETLARRVERVSLVVTHLEGRRHLPIVKLREAA